LLAGGEGSVGGNAEGLERYLWVALVGVEAAGVELPAAEQRWRRWRSGEGGGARPGP